MGSTLQWLVNPRFPTLVLTRQHYSRHESSPTYQHYAKYRRDSAENSDRQARVGSFDAIESLQTSAFESHRPGVVSTTVSVVYHDDYASTSAILDWKLRPWYHIHQPSSRVALFSSIDIRRSELETRKDEGAQEGYGECSSLADEEGCDIRFRSWSMRGKQGF